jgi:uncharacterized protein (TIGR03435 family)
LQPVGIEVTFNHTTLLNVLTRAFGLSFPSQVVGPSWIFTDRYDIVAKAPDNTPQNQIPRMLETLVTDRFQLTLHHETRDLPAYTLILGKGRLKLQEVKDPAVKNDWTIEGDRREAKSMSVAAL